MAQMYELVTKVWIYARVLRMMCMGQNEKMWRVAGWPENIEMRWHISLSLLQSQISLFHFDDPYLRSMKAALSVFNDVEHAVCGWTLFLRSSDTMVPTYKQCKIKYMYECTWFSRDWLSTRRHTTRTSRHHSPCFCETSLDLLSRDFSLTVPLKKRIKSTKTTQIKL